MDKLQRLHSFWSSFNLPAYDENSVPDSATLPYITYEAVTDDFNNTVFISASLWYRATSWVAIETKQKEIAEYIGKGGRYCKYDGGAFWVRKSHPWSQRMAEPSDDMIRRIILNIMIEYID